MTGTTVTTPRPSRAARGVRGVVADDDRGTALVRFRPRTGSRSTSRMSPRRITGVPRPNERPGRRPPQRRHRRSRPNHLRPPGRSTPPTRSRMKRRAPDAQQAYGPLERRGSRVQALFPGVQVHESTSSPGRLTLTFIPTMLLIGSNAVATNSIPPPASAPKREQPSGGHPRRHRSSSPFVRIGGRRQQRRDRVGALAHVVQV